MDLIFQSTLPRGERLNLSIRSWLIINFNPRSHEGSDGIGDAFPLSRYAFQSTLPRGERHYKPWFFQIWEIFQSTLPRGERQIVILFANQYDIFQSTLPRGERQQFSPRSSLFSQQKLSKIFNLNNKLF